MAVKLLESILDEVPSEWNIRVLIPPLVFWIGGLIAWCLSKGWRWSQILDLFTKIETTSGLILFVGGILLVIASSEIIDWFQLPILRVIEGYYWPEWLSDSFTESKNTKINDILSDECGKKYVEKETELDKHPLDQNLRMPTRLGDLLRAAEEYPFIRYGLDPIVLWSRFWLLLPESTKKELTLARQVLDERSSLLVWFLIFATWSIFVWWVLPIVIVATLMTYYIGMLSAAEVYGELLRAAFDVHRFLLYEALHLPLPTSPEDEPEFGLALTDYLRRGIISPDMINRDIIKFQHDQETESS